MTKPGFYDGDPTLIFGDEPERLGDSASTMHVIGVDGEHYEIKINARGGIHVHCSRALSIDPHVANEVTIKGGVR